MKSIVIKYNDKDFFGGPVYRDDKCCSPKCKDVSKALRFLKQNDMVAMDVNYEDGTTEVIYWDTLKEFNNGIITVKEYICWNSAEEKKCSFDMVKKKIMQQVKHDKEEKLKEMERIA